MAKRIDTKDENIKLDPSSGIYYWREMIDGVQYEKSTRQKTFGSAKTAVKKFRSNIQDEPSKRSTFVKAMDESLKIKKGKAPETFREAESADKRMREWFQKNCPYLDKFEKQYETVWEDYKSFAYSRNFETIGRKGKLWHDRKWLVFVINRAHKKGWTKRSYGATDFPLSEAPDDHGRNLEDWEVKRLWESAIELGYELEHDQMKMYYYHGFRKDELLGMPIKEYNPKTRKFSLQAKRTKTRRDRIVPVHPECYEIIDKYYEEAKAAKGKYFWPSRTNPKGGTYQTKDFSKPQSDFSKYRKKRLIEHSGVHHIIKDWRKTRATRLAKARYPMVAACIVLGMSPKMLTKIYAEVDFDLQEEWRRV